MKISKHNLSVALIVSIILLWASWYNNKLEVFVLLLPLTTYFIGLIVGSTIEIIDDVFKERLPGDALEEHPQNEKKY